ncbi:TetR/AcrR family transcriptional regulator [Micromonospora sp. NPDC004704]
MQHRLPQSLRSDARDNRDRILDVSRATFAAEGLAVTMREIARRSEVGVATLYRRFPTKESLVTEAFTEQMAACTLIVDEAVLDPWRGFCTVIEKVSVLHALDRGFTAAFVSAFPDAVDFAQARERALRNFAQLVRRAKESGELRPEFVLDDLIMMVMANGGIRTTSPVAAVAAARRFAALMIESFRTRPGSAPLPPAVRLPLVTAL